MPRALPILTLFLLLLGLSGCAPLVKIEQGNAAEFTHLSGEKTAGQTFTARYAGLEGVDLFLKPESPGEGQLRLHLRAGPHETADLATGELPLEEVSAPGYYRFTFPPQAESTGRDYYLFIQVEGSGSVRVGGSGGETYLNGARYQDHRPEDAQLTFRLAHNRRQALIGLAGEAFRWLGRLAAAAFLFVLPGWALLDRLMPGWRTLSRGEQLGLASGVSLAFYPLLFLWTGLVGLRLGAVYAWAPGLAALGTLAWQTLASKRRAGPAGRRAQSVERPGMVGDGQARGIKDPLPDLALLFLMVLIFATRFWAIRNLEIPLWGDSYQHTLITQLLVDHGGIFTSWEPYAELRTFTYHFGFHSLAAVFSWVTRLPAPQAVLWTGQILNGLAALALYPLATSLGRSRWAGTAATLVAGLLAPMPMFYVNWGRYTELAGLVILPAMVYAVGLFLKNREILRFAQDDRKREGKFHSLEDGPPEGEILRFAQDDNEVEGDRIRRNVVARRFLPKQSHLLLLVWILLGGLALTHYRVLVFAVLFFPAALVFHLRHGRALSFVIKTGWIGAGAGLLFLPWFLRVFSGRILQVLGQLATTSPAQIPVRVAEYNMIGDPFDYLPAALWLLLLVALGWGLLRRERGATLIALWWLLILLAANPNWLGLPGAGVLSNFAVFIAFYLPAGALVGAAVGWLMEHKKRSELAAGPARGRQASTGTQLLVFGILLALGLWGARDRVNDLAVTQSALATRPDQRAARWIQANTPQSTLFLVNSFPAYGDTLIAGSDGGWWLPLLALRDTTLPPINYSSEQGPRPDYLVWTNTLTFTILDRGLEDPETLQLLRERGVTHAYIGQRQGQVGNPAPPLLQAEPLLANPSFRLVYQEDRVLVFEMVDEE